MLVEDKFKFISRVQGSPWIHSNYIRTWPLAEQNMKEQFVTKQKRTSSASQQNLPDRPCTQDSFQCKCSVHSLALLCSNSFVRAGERGTEPQISSNFQRKCSTFERVMLAAVRIDFNIRLPTQLPNLKKKRVTTKVFTCIHTVLSIHILIPTYVPSTRKTQASETRSLNVFTVLLLSGDCLKSRLS